MVSRRLHSFERNWRKVSFGSLSGTVGGTTRIRPRLGKVTYPPRLPL